MKSNVNLSTFDGRLMNGLDFCRTVYDFFEQIRPSPGGVNKLRLRNARTEKKLIEELIPIARYIQARYSEARLLKVRWVDGEQQYDALLLSSGASVENGKVLKRQHVEVTTVVHENDHLGRELISQGHPAFGVKGIRRDPVTKRIESQPYVYQGKELQADLAKKILDTIKVKDGINYPSGTALVIQCVLETLVLNGEWRSVISQVKTKLPKHRFSEVFILDSRQGYSACVSG